MKRIVLAAMLLSVFPAKSVADGKDIVGGIIVGAVIADLLREPEPTPQPVIVIHEGKTYQIYTPASRHFRSRSRHNAAYARHFPCSSQFTGLQPCITLIEKITIK